jgi:hypothetical protein
MLPRQSSASQQEGRQVAETARGKKFIRIQGYTRADGTKVPTHDRSTPSTSSGPKSSARRRKH